MPLIDKDHQPSLSISVARQIERSIQIFLMFVTPTKKGSSVNVDRHSKAFHHSRQGSPCSDLMQTPKTMTLHTRHVRFFRPNVILVVFVRVLVMFAQRNKSTVGGLLTKGSATVTGHCRLLDISSITWSACLSHLPKMCVVVHSKPKNERLHP